MKYKLIGGWSKDGKVYCCLCGKRTTDEDVTHGGAIVMMEAMRYPFCYIAFGKVYFIQDRYIGGEKYEYALMSRPLERKIPQHFTNVRKMVSNLIGSEITDEIAVNLLLSQKTEYQCNSYRIIENNGVRYVWDDKRKELREHTEPKQETGYCSTYFECLSMAKEILKNK